MKLIKYQETRAFLGDPKKDYYEPKKTVMALNNNYIQHESIEDKDNSFLTK